DHRRALIGIDGEDVLGRPAANHVLDGTADAARDIEVGGDPRPGLPNLVGMRPPAEAGDGARAANRAAEQARQLLERGETFRTPDAPTSADDDTSLRQ